MLTYAFTWHATWLRERALTMPQKRYRALLTARLADVAKHGDPERYRRYLPGYLLKCIQDWFRHHGEDLYDELKHVRNALGSIDELIDNLKTAKPRRPDPTDALAQAHDVLRAARRQKRARAPKQLELF